MEAIYHAEGRVSWQGSGYRYEYTLRDHLGNSRVMFADLNADNEVDETEILQQNHYYPFGMNMEGIWPGGTNKYQYNGNEAQSEVDHNVSDFNFRTYDAGIGRFWQVDILADWATDLTPYRFGFNNPVRYADPLGLWEENEDGWTTDNPEGIGDLMKSLEIIGDQGYSIQRGDGLDDEAFRMIPDDLSGVNILHNRNGNPSVSNQRNFPAGPNSEQNIFGYPNPERSPAIESVDDPFTFVAGGVGKSVVKGVVSLTEKILVGNAAKGGSNVVYHSVQNGVTNYVGITNNLARRSAEHLAHKGISIQPLMKGLSRADARAVEQALIEIHGLSKNGGTLLNKINSISSKSPIYGQQLQRGYDLLKSIGY